MPVMHFEGDEVQAAQPSPIQQVMDNMATLVLGTVVRNMVAPVNDLGGGIETMGSGLSVLPMTTQMNLAGVLMAGMDVVDTALQGDIVGAVGKSAFYTGAMLSPGLVHDTIGRGMLPGQGFMSPMTVMAGMFLNGLENSAMALEQNPVRAITTLPELGAIRDVMFFNATHAGPMSP